MEQKFFIPGALLALALTACGGGAGMTPAAGAPTVSAPVGTAPATTQKAAAMFTLSLPASIDATSQAQRSVQFISPKTTTVYIALENSPGHGNAAFAYTESINATNCSTLGGTTTCAFVVQMPVGTDTFSVLTTGAAHIPLSYGNWSTTITATGPNASPPEQSTLSPIPAGATPAYAFGTIANNPPNPKRPVVTMTVVDAAGDGLSLIETNDAPFGDVFTPVTATQTVGQFTVDTVLHGTFVGSSSPENTAALGPIGSGPYLEEVGNGTTAAFTTTLTLTTSLVAFTQSEFPQFTTAALTVPASSSSLTLTCQFPTTPTGTDPCPGTGAATIGIH